MKGYPRPFTAKWAIPMEDSTIHTDERPVCDDLTCPCHEEQAHADEQKICPCPAEKGVDVPVPAA